MTTYQETVLNLGPLFYARLDDLSGSVITDISGNGNHGVYASDVVYGIASPIETDASSKAASGRVGYVPATLGSQLDLTAAFTWMGWCLNGAGVAKVMLARNGGPGLNSTNWVAIDSGQVAVRLSPASGTTHNLVYSSLVDDAWYFIAVTRNTNVIRLYVNGVLRDEDTLFPAGDYSYTNYSNSSWKIGASHNSVGTSTTHGNVWLGAGTDEPALFDYALTAGQILTVYEAALASLPMSATITIRVVVELDTDQIIPVDFPFVHNFADAIAGTPNPVTEILSYKTNVNQSEPDYQQRINAQPYHAERTLEYAITVMGQQRSRLQAALWTPGEVYTLPIANDWGTLTSQATAGAVTLSLDTTLRDYEIGSYVSVWEDIFDASTHQRFLITSRTDTELGISPAVGTAIPNGSPVMPARLAHLPEDSLTIDSHSIDRETAILQFEILSTELSSRRVTSYTPATTYLSLEVFSLERAKVEWLDPSQYQITRRFQGTGTPTGNDYQRAIDTGSPQTVPLRVLLTTRAAISEFYGWVDARQGKINPVWVVSEDNDLNVTARAGSPGRITISHIGYAARYGTHRARRDLAILKTDSTYVYRRVTAAVDNGDRTETLTLDADPPLLADISKVSFLRFCTAPDQFEIRYHRNGSGFIAESEFVLTELLSTPA
jgi:hypothetical protein